MGRVAEAIIQVGLIVLILGGVLFASYWVQLHYLHLPHAFVVAVTCGSSIALFFTALYGYRIGYLQRWGEPRHDVARQIAVFRRKCQLVIFGLVAIVPVLLAISSLFANVTFGALLFLISLLVCPWALRKFASAW